MSENATPAEPVKPQPPSYWTWRRRFAFVFIQLSLLCYAVGAGGFGASYAISFFYSGADRQISIAQALPLTIVLYAIGGLMILAVFFDLIALIFSRRALYLWIFYVPTGLYAYYMWTV